MINLKIKLFLLTGTLFLMLLLRWQGSGLITDYAPSGIVSLELAASADKTTSLIQGWTKDGLIGKVRNNILLDYLFIPFYVMLFYTLCGSISVRRTGLSAKLGVLLAFFSLIAGMFDVLENILMMFSSFSLYTSISALLTAMLAGFKFFLLFLALLYVIFVGTPLFFRKFAP
jgi:hypothetical protein